MSNGTEKLIEILEGLIANHQRLLNSLVELKGQGGSIASDFPGRETIDDMIAQETEAIARLNRSVDHLRKF